MVDAGAGPYLGHNYYECGRVKENEWDENLIAFLDKSRQQSSVIFEKQSG